MRWVEAQRIVRTGQFQTTVVSVTQLSPRMRRIVLESSGIADQSWPLGCDVAVVLHGEDGRELRRRYTVRSTSGDSLTLDALLHGHGPGSAWASSATPGDRVSVLGPRGRVDLPAASWRVAFTDESGLPAIAALAEALRSSPGRGEQTLLVYAETADEGEVYPLPPNAVAEWLIRAHRPAGGAELLLSGVDRARTALARLYGDAAMDEAGFGYVLGESRTSVAVRDALLELGLDRSHVYAKGYWNLHARPTR
jgi:NADPH-dependent ferric siderophore reductase